jgi:hypothetical protein
VRTTDLQLPPIRKSLGLSFHSSSSNLLNLHFFQSTASSMAANLSEGALDPCIQSAPVPNIGSSVRQPHSAAGGQHAPDPTDAHTSNSLSLTHVVPQGMIGATDLMVCYVVGKNAFQFSSVKGLDSSSVRFI